MWRKSKKRQLLLPTNQTLGYTRTTNTTYECTTHHHPPTEEDRRVPPQHSGLTIHPHQHHHVQYYGSRQKQQRSAKPRKFLFCPFGKFCGVHSASSRRRASAFRDTFLSLLLPRTVFYARLILKPVLDLFCFCFFWVA